MIFKNQITEEKLPNSIKFEKSHGNLVIEFDDNKTRFKIENYTYGSKTYKSEFTLNANDKTDLRKLFEDREKELIDCCIRNQQKFDKLFQYFFDQIDPMTQNGSVNSKLEEIDSEDELISYYETNMTIRDLKSWERKSP